MTQRDTTIRYWQSVFASYAYIVVYMLFLTYLLNSTRWGVTSFVILNLLAGLLYHSIVVWQWASREVLNVVGWGVLGWYVILQTSLEALVTADRRPNKKLSTVPEVDEPVETNVDY